LFSARGIFRVGTRYPTRLYQQKEGTTASLSPFFSKKWKNLSSALRRKRTWVQHRRPTSLRHRSQITKRGLYSSPSSPIRNTLQKSIFF
jgi:hypothetical protein